MDYRLFPRRKLIVSKWVTDTDLRELPADSTFTVGEQCKEVTVTLLCLLLFQIVCNFCGSEEICQMLAERSVV